MATRCCSPPDSVSARCQARARRPTWSRQRSATVALRPVERSRRAPRTPPAAQVRQPPHQHVVEDAEPLHQVELLVDHAHPRAMGAEPGPSEWRRSTSPIRIAPSVGTMARDRHRSSVVFPAPERPMTATNSPGRMQVETDSSATWAPKRLADPLQHHHRGGRSGSSRGSP